MLSQRPPAFLRRLLHLPRPHRDPRLHADRGLDRAVHQRRDAAADPVLLRRAAPGRAAARQRPALPAHGRHRRGRRRQPPDLLRDARQLVAGRLLQARVALVDARVAALDRHPVRAPRRDGLRATTPTRAPSGGSRASRTTGCACSGARRTGGARPARTAPAGRTPSSSTSTTTGAGSSWATTSSSSTSRVSDGSLRRAAAAQRRRRARPGADRLRAARRLLRL